MSSLLQHVGPFIIKGVAKESVFGVEFSKDTKAMCFGHLDYSRSCIKKQYASLQSSFGRLQQC